MRINVAHKGVIHCNDLFVTKARVRTIIKPRQKQEIKYNNQLWLKHKSAVTNSLINSLDKERSELQQFA